MCYGNLRDTLPGVGINKGDPGSVIPLMKYYVSIIILLILCGDTALGFLSGPIAGRTGAPNDICDGLTCNVTPCHDTYGLNTGTATFSITAPSSYEKGETMDIRVSFQNSTASLHGFEITAVDENDARVGTFTTANDMVQTESYLNQYAAHTTIGTAESGWTVQWTAPSGNVSDSITFYAAGNEANGDGTSKGDHIYTTSVAISLAEECAPSILKVKPKKLVVKRGKSAVVTVTVKGEDNKPCANHTVYATTADKKVTLAESAETDDSGKVRFTVTAGEEKGKDTITFRAKDDGAGITKSIKVLVK